MLFRWHNVELFPIPPTRRSDDFFPVPRLYIEKKEVTAILRVPSPTLLAYYRNLFREFATGCEDQPTKQDLYGTILCALMVVEFAVMASMTFLPAAGDGEHAVVPDHERRAYCGILLPLPRGVRDTLDQLCAFHLVEASLFDATRAFRTFHLSTQIECNGIDCSSPLLNFNFDTGVIYNYAPRPSRHRDDLCRYLFDTPCLPMPWKEGVWPDLARDSTCPKQLERNASCKWMVRRSPTALRVT